MNSKVNDNIASRPVAGVRRRAFVSDPRARHAVGVAVFGAALGCLGVAQAQQAGTSLAGAAGMPVGADRVAIDATAGAAYDSNISGGNNSVASLRGLQPEDVTYTLGATATFQLPSSRQNLFLTAAADLQRHQNNSVLDGDNYRISAGAMERLGVCSATGIVGYAHRQTLVQDLAVAVSKNIVKQEDGHLDFVCGRRSVFVELTGGATKVSNDAPTAGFVNSTTENAALSVGYRSQSLGDISLFSQYSEINYEDNPLFGGAIPDVRQYGAGVNYARKIGLRLSGTASVSYNQIEGGLGNIRSDGLNASASLAYRLSSRTQLTLDYSLGNAASPLTNTSYVHSEMLQLAGTYLLTKRISFHASASRSTQDYRGIQPSALLQIHQSTTDQIGGGVDVKIGRKISVGLTAMHLNRSADIALFDYSDNRVAITLTGKY